MTEQPIIAFHGDPLQKAKFVDIITLAKKEKRLVAGDYWCESNHLGCLVGQIGHDATHTKFAEDMQTPLWFPYLLDSVFENLPEGKRQQFAVNVIKSIPVGFADWQSYYHRFCVFLLEKICKNTDHPDVRQVIADIIMLHKNEEQDEQKWSATESAAWSATESAARSAARSATESAAWSATESAAWSATESAAWSARSAAWSARSAWSAAWSATYLKISKKIISLFGEDYSK